MKKLPREFYLQDTLTVARQLIGKLLVHEHELGKLIARISETEAYIGRMDKACHAYGYKRTQRTEPLFLAGGHAYVYLIYGMYDCFNIVTEMEEEPCAVLIRGAVALNSLDGISRLRYQKAFNELSAGERKRMADGPGKLCRAMGISRAHNKLDLCGNQLYLCDDGWNDDKSIETSKRINIDYAEEAKDFLWRFSAKL